MKRIAIFAILGPALAVATLYAIVLPVAGLLEGVPIWIKVQDLPVSYIYWAVPALVIAVFDWVASLIEVPFRPVAVAIAGWMLAAITLREVFALPDVPGWFIVIGLLGGIPAFACSWLTLKMAGKPVSA